MASCPECSESLETPLGCGACGRVLPAEDPDPFAVFGFERAYAVDKKALRKRLLRFSRLVHPDFFGDASADQRALAEANSAVLNTAFGLLSDDFRRADRLVRDLGGPAESDERQMPQAFLMEVMEWNEAIEEAREEPSAEAREDLSRLHIHLQEERADLFDAISRGLDPLPPPGDPKLVELRKTLNAIRYVDRVLHEVEALRLDLASAG